MPQSVYDNLIAAVRKHLPAVHHYYEIRRRKMRLKTIHHYDTYVPILSDLKSRHSWDEAVRLVIAALQPLGSDYCRVLEGGSRPLVRSISQSGQAERGFQLRQLRCRPLHLDELQARRAGRRLHAGP